jgi:predicted SprT family Zn-dependent metalloprotease
MDFNKAAVMARDLMDFHGLINWHFKFDRSLTRLGCCHHMIKTISLGRHATLVNDEATVKNTILHEISHSLVGSQHGHDEVWRAKAKEIGCTGDRLGTIAIKAQPKAMIFCNSCSRVTNLYRVTKRYLYRLNDMWCVPCGREKSKGQLVLERV